MKFALAPMIIPSAYTFPTPDEGFFSQICAVTSGAVNCAKQSLASLKADGTELQRRAALEIAPIIAASIPAKRANLSRRFSPAWPFLGTPAGPPNLARPFCEPARRVADADDGRAVERPRGAAVWLLFASRAQLHLRLRRPQGKPDPPLARTFSPAQHMRTRSAPLRLPQLTDPLRSSPRLVLPSSLRPPP